MSLYNVSESHCDDNQIRFKRYILQENINLESQEDRNEVENSELNKQFTVNEVEYLINKSKNNKAPGMDGLVYDVLKNEPSIDLLTRLLNLCFENRIVPATWLQALIYPIPKSLQNDPRVPLNYRGISLLPVISKLYTATLNKRLNIFTENNDTIVNEQNGFRPGRSCLDHIFVLQNTLRIRNQPNSETYCAFIDFKKAFDFVDRDFLLYKLHKSGAQGNFYHAIKAPYSGAQSCIQVDHMVTGWFDVNSVVRQGESLSPTLYFWMI